VHGPTNPKFMVQKSGRRGTEEAERGTGTELPSKSLPSRWQKGSQSHEAKLRAGTLCHCVIPATYS